MYKAYFYSHNYTFTLILISCRRLLEIVLRSMIFAILAQLLEMHVILLLKLLMMHVLHYSDSGITRHARGHVEVN